MMKQGSLIRLLNPVLRGWANYHRVAVAKKTFNFVDHQVWKLLWWWAKRRHPKKVWPWIKDRYYKRIGGWKGVFATETERLVIVGQTPIRRHVKIQGDANPFDASQDTYFNARRRRKLGQELSGRRTLYGLWRMQDGKCPNCLQPFASDEEWHLPSRVSKGQGSDGLLAYQQLLHPDDVLGIHRGTYRLVPNREVFEPFEEAILRWASRLRASRFTRGSPTAAAPWCASTSFPTSRSSRRLAMSSSSSCSSSTPTTPRTPSGRSWPGGGACA